MSRKKCQVVVTFIFLSEFRVIFRFLPNLRRLNKIIKKVKSINLKTNEKRTKE